MKEQQHKTQTEEDNNNNSKQQMETTEQVNHSLERERIHKRMKNEATQSRTTHIKSNRQEKEQAGAGGILMNSGAESVGYRGRLEGSPWILGPNLLGIGDNWTDTQGHWG